MPQTQKEKRLERIREHCREWSWCSECQYRGKIVNGKWTCAEGMDWKKLRGDEE